MSMEPRYKSKHNKAFMWQSRRLFGRHHLRVYAKKEAFLRDFVVGCDETSSPSNRFRQVYGKTEFMDFVRFSRGRLPPEPPKVEAEVVDTEAAKPPEEAAKEVPQKWGVIDLRFEGDRIGEWNEHGLIGLEAEF